MKVERTWKEKSFRMDVLNWIANEDGKMNRKKRGLEIG